MNAVRPLSRRALALLAPLVGALVVLGLVTVPTSPATAIGEPTFTNTLVNGADPWLEYFEGNYYLATTTWGAQVTMRKSPTLAGLKTAAETTVYSDTDPSRSANMWAPDMHRLKGPDGAMHWYLMYTMGRPGTYDQQHMHVLESVGDDPMGPYRYRGRPIPTDAWNIDGSYLQLNGELYAIWSQFAPDGLQSNYIAKMTNPWTAASTGTILSQPTQDWERLGGPVNEGPVQLDRGGKTYIVYSASNCQSQDYRLGMLTYRGGDPASAASWTKSNGAVFSKANGVYGPGHNGFFTSPDGTQTWNVYHGNSGPNDGCSTRRTTRAQPVTWDANNVPSFGQPVAEGTQVPVPSGERGPLSPKVQGAGWQLVNRNSGLCAITAGDSPADGGDVVQGSCGAASATWTLDSTADGYYRVVNKATNKSLDAANCGPGNGTDVRQWAWLTNECQQWRPTQAADGWTTLTNRSANKVLDVANCGTGAGANVQLWSSLGNACQQWALRPVGQVSVVSAQSGKALELPGCSTADGAVAQQWQWLASPCQRMTFTAAGGGLEIHPVSAPSKCLVVRDGATNDGADVVQASCGRTGSTWRAEPLPDGSTRLVALHSGKSLDLAGCGLADGTRIGQWSSLDNQCQRFRIAG